MIMNTFIDLDYRLKIPGDVSLIVSLFELSHDEHMQVIFPEQLHKITK